jgi:nicotinamidase-related amidase
MRQRFPWLSPFWPLAIAGIAAVVPAFAAMAFDDAKPLELRLRSRPEADGQFRLIETPAKWAPSETAFIVCDMWDLHHCANAVKRETEMAPTMERVLKTARDQGVVIIHAPSSCMDSYKEHPARKHAMGTSRSKTLPKEIGSWCYNIPDESKGKYPIDQTDGGEDDDPIEHKAWAAKLSSMGRNPKAPWKSQIDVLTIADHDYISDNGEEIWSILEARGIKNVVLMGVHLNMCVLGRPFGLRQMAKNGKNVVLMRDMTDTMYNPKMAPFVSHFAGTDLMVEHVEKFVCPTITSDQVLGGKPFRFQDDTRPTMPL